MYFNKKYYKIINTKFFFKSNSFFLLTCGINQNSVNLSIFLKKLHEFNFNQSKILNSIFKIVVQNSTKKFLHPLINGCLFFIKNNCSAVLRKPTTLAYLTSIIFFLKLNNNIYFFYTIQNINSYNYYQNKQLFRQFLIIKFKKLNFLDQKFESV